MLVRCALSPSLSVLTCSMPLSTQSYQKLTLNQHKSLARPPVCVVCLSQYCSFVGGGRVGQGAWVDWWVVRHPHARPLAGAGTVRSDDNFHGLEKEGDRGERSVCTNEWQ
jgi:hypothetical protein